MSSKLAEHCPHGHYRGSGCPNGCHMMDLSGLWVEVCPGCKNQIDPNCCGCGEALDCHDSMWSGHPFVPMGCDCLRCSADRESVGPFKTPQEMFEDDMERFTSSGGEKP